MYQESRFDPKAKSWVGAKGLMQVMPRTGAELKIYDLESPDQGILAGTKVMSRYSNYFNNPEINARDRIRFALASYNCGPGHVFDARDLAKEMGLDPNKWFGHVEKSMLLLSKKEMAKKVRYAAAARSRSITSARFKIVTTTTCKSCRCSSMRAMECWNIGMPTCWVFAHQSIIPSFHPSYL